MLEPHEIQLGMGFAADLPPRRVKAGQGEAGRERVTPPAARDLGHAVAEFLLAVLA